METTRKPTAIQDISAVILAGGKSTRYGKNKALVEIQGLSLIERVTGVLKSLFRDIYIITNTPDDYAYLEIPMFEDLIKGLGPLGGIYTALKKIPCEAGFFVACDMPCLNPGLIRHMVSIRNGFDVVVPRLGRELETLHAIYHKRCLVPAKKLIDSGKLQILQFFGEVSVRYVDKEDIRRFDPELTSFLNINRPEEVKLFDDGSAPHDKGYEKK